ncbi:MAG TPA: acyl-CoA dehydrogenase family protein, partial [Fimbriimonadaceae bacterium]|nr:acyl-CoA dehydrogenase family protein [Fimbriimonadaceae bacterium]
MISSFSEPAAERFRGEVRAWLDKNWPLDQRNGGDLLTEDEQIEIRRHWDRKLYEAGYAGLSWPREHGGSSAGPVADAILYEELAFAHAPEGLGRIGRVMAGPLIMAYGTTAQRERFLPRILDGTEIWCLGYSEPGAGSDLASIATSAVRDGDGYAISGRKIWTSHAHYADRCVLLAKSSN